MNKLEIFKGITELAVSIGVSSIVGNAIKMTTDPDAGKIKKVAIGIGGFVLSNMIGDMATKYTNEKIDGTADRLKKIIHPKTPDEVDIPEGLLEYMEEDNRQVHNLHVHEEVEWDIDRDQPMSKTIADETINKIKEEGAQ